MSSIFAKLLVIFVTITKLSLTESFLLFPNEQYDCTLNIYFQNQRCDWCENLINFNLPFKNPVYISTSLSTNHPPFQLKDHCRISWYISSEYSNLKIYLDPTSKESYDLDILYYFIVPNWSGLKTQFWNEWLKLNFQKISPKAVIIFPAKKDWTWTFSCFLCPDSYGIIESTPIPNRGHILQLHRKLNYVGYGRPVYETTGLPTVNTRALHNIPKIQEYEKFLRTQFIWGIPNVDILIGIASQSKYLNFTSLATLTTTLENTNINRQPGIHLCVHCAYPQSKYSHIQEILFFVNVHSFLYCKKSVTLIEPSMTAVMLGPFDLITWLVLASSLVIIRITRFKLNFWNNLDVLWEFLAQAGQQINRSAIYFCATVSVIFLQQLYLSYFSSSIILPFVPTEIKTNLGLFEQGFKIIVDPKDENFTQEFTESFKFSFNKFNMTEDHVMKNLYLNPIKTECQIYEKWQQIVGCTADEGAELTQYKFRNQYKAGIENLFPGSISCEVIPEPFATRWVTVYAMYHLSEAFYEFFNQLISGGIDVFWEGLYIQGFTRQSAKIRRVASSMKAPCEGSLKTSILPTFKFCGIMVGLCWLVYLGEAIFFLVNCNLADKVTVL